MAKKNIAEKVMWNGYPIVLSPEVWERIQEPRYTQIISPSGAVSYKLEMNLKKLGQMYCGVDLDKSIRGKIIYQGLTNEIIK